MSRPVSAPFFSAHPVFNRAEYAAAVGRSPHDKTVSAMLGQHLRVGNIKRIARGVFASVPKHADAATWSVNRFLAASRLRSNSIIAYHSALELHGRAYTEAREVQVIALGEPGVCEFAGFTCRFVNPPRGLLHQDGKSLDGVTTVDRMGLKISVTTVERTIADLFDRYDLAGGAEELFNSLNLFVRIDVAILIRYMNKLGNATAAGALGYWLEQEQNVLRIPPEFLAELHAMAPRHAQYALGTKPGQGRMAKGWNVILPVEIVERRFEGM